MTQAGGWPSPLSAEAVAMGGLKLAQPSVHGAHSYWLEGRPAERGRVALMCAGTDDPGIELTPDSASVRSRINEYGGGAFLACDAGTFFVDDAADPPGQVWKVLAPGRAAPLTRAAGLRFADLALDATRHRLVAVCEDGRADPHRPTQSLVAIALADGALTTLATGRGFYACPRVAASAHPQGCDRTSAATVFLCWDLPAMPWDGAELWRAVGDAAPQHLAGPAAFQPEFAADGALWWCDDAPGRATLVRSQHGVVRLPDGTRECALPLWNLNMRSFHPLPDGGAIAASVADGLWQLRRLGADGGWSALPGAEDLTQVEHVAGAGDRVVVLGGGPQSALAVHELHLGRGTRRVLARSSALELAAEWLSAPEPLRFAATDGECHALYWPPRSATHRLAPGERPPLLLRCHGGPTAAASSALDARTLFWTTRGFAVLDVNYRGSWGYGRDYRRALDGRWGELDAADAVAAARQAIASGRCDPARVAITGSSAGGLTALNALTLPGQPFASAGIHYGIADLVTAMRDTHKFEAGYGTTLLGPWPAARAAWEARSPLNRLAALRTPCILFQGLDDRVVPPDQTERLAAALAAAGVRVALQRYADEGHGFRRSATIADALARELAFHTQSFAAAGGA